MHPRTGDNITQWVYNGPQVVKISDKIPKQISKHVYLYNSLMIFIKWNVTVKRKKEKLWPDLYSKVL